MPYVTVLGLRMFFQRSGSNRTAIVLVHGAAWSHRLWRSQIPVLSTGGEVIAVDLPGHGVSDELPAGQTVSIKSYADQIHLLLSAVKSSSAILVGHSMGGGISMRYALDHPEKVEALVLVSTGAKLGVLPTITEGLSTSYKQTITTGIGRWSFAEETDKHVIEDGVNQMLECRQKVAIMDFKACNEFDIRDCVSRIGAPTLIIVGNEDKLTPVKWSEYLHNRITGSELRIINGAGHMVMLEKPNEVNEALLSFIKRTIPPKRT